MPSTSKAQHRFMQAVAHDPAFAKKAGVPQKVGKDFADADSRQNLKKLPEKKGKAQRRYGGIVFAHRSRLGDRGGESES